MDLSKVIFIGGNGISLASSQIRCVDIAARLGCDCLLGAQCAHQIPDKYSAFVCVKPWFWAGELEKLAKRGLVIWDIIDDPPPREHIAIYLASTTTASEIFRSHGRVEVIPHHHCNVSGSPNPPNLRRPAWIGSSHWRPQLHGFEHDYYDVKGMNRNDVAQAYRKIGISLNFREERPSIYPLKHRKLLRDFHIAINSGIKLINCFGFGTPSLSANEPAYYEIGEGCTIFSDLKRCARWVKELQHDNELYQELRKKCLHKASTYHLDTIAEKYQQLLHSL